jgi:hypothetical protein
LGLALLPLLALFGIAGCGPSTATVKGKVSYQNKPLKGGKIIFTSKGKGDVVADIGKDGTYEAEKVPVGKVKVAIQTKYLDPKERTGMAYAPPKDAGNESGYKPPERPKGEYTKIDEKYESGETSGLEYDVASGENNKDWDLQ